jgi:subtilisin family serine protease
VRHRRLLPFALATAAGVTLGACNPDGTAPRNPAAAAALSSPATFSAAPSFAAVTAGSETSYLILGAGNKLPADLATRVSQAGGTLTNSVAAIGVATATSSSLDFAAKVSAIRGVDGVAQDRLMQWIDPSERVVEAQDLGSDETFYNTQWGPKAIHAPEAWDLGARGAGVRVAVIDGGLNNTHIDLQGSVDEARSRSFVAGFNYNQDVAGFSHATHVAGIIAAQDDGIGTIGIAPSATIIGVKVLHNGSGSFAAVIAGIVYAATPISQGGAGADVINMSLGAGFYRQGVGAAQLASALSRATTYAYQQGTTVIAAAGNSAVDIDHTSNLIFVPAQSANVIAVSALGPVGFAQGATNFDRPASYTNFGQSAIGLAAPGGDFVLPGNASCTLPRIPTGTVTTACWVFDMVMSPGSIPGNTGYFWAAGTSMAAPHVAGVAALIIGKNGGPMQPAQVEAKLRQSSDDLGKPGNDDFYGAGRVNALRAVQ